MNGVTRAAYAVGIDTDTIASMTGGLSGTISGTEWLSPVRANVQDSEYLRVTAEGLATKNKVTRTVAIPRHGIRSQLNKFKDHHLKVGHDKSLGLPDGRLGEIVSVNETIGKNGRFKVFFYRIKVDDGQSIEIPKIVKGSFEDKQPPVSTLRIPVITSQKPFGWRWISAWNSLRAFIVGWGKVFQKSSPTIRTLNFGIKLPTRKLN